MLSHIFLSGFFQDFATSAKVAVQKLIQKVGFLGILACASVSEIEQVDLFCFCFCVIYFSPLLCSRQSKYVFSFIQVHINLILTFVRHRKGNASSNMCKIHYKQKIHIVKCTFEMWHTFDTFQIYISDFQLAFLYKW